MNQEDGSGNVRLERTVRRGGKSYDGIKAHYTPEQLDELEKRAREWARMDMTDKLKLINMARYALSVAAERDRYRAALEKLARLGNEPHYGNSDGNRIAQEALGVEVGVDA